MTNNLNIFTIHESLLKNVINILQAICQNKAKVPGKWASSEFIYKDR